MGKMHLEYFDVANIYICMKCKCHLSTLQELVSKDFQARDGKAFLYNKALNYYSGPTENKMLRTGLYRVCDVFCVNCQNKVGWKYEWAQEHDQKYKEGKVILERNHIEKIDWVR